MTVTGEHPDGVQLCWRASPLALVIAAAAAAALAGAVIGSSWRLIAFAAPLLGVLCSIGWQPPVPVVRVQARPASRRCFEAEPAAVTIRAAAVGAPPTSVKLVVTAHPTACLQVVGEGVDAAGASASVLCTAGRFGRYPIRARVAVTGCGGLLTGTAVVDAADVTVFPLTPPTPTRSRTSSCPTGSAPT